MKYLVPGGLKTSKWMHVIMLDIGVCKSNAKADAVS